VTWNERTDHRRRRRDVLVRLTPSRTGPSRPRQWIRLRD
jgi:hypothetical protein